MLLVRLSRLNQTFATCKKKLTVYLKPVSTLHISSEQRQVNHPQSTFPEEDWYLRANSGCQVPCVNSYFALCTGACKRKLTLS